MGNAEAFVQKTAVDTRRGEDQVKTLQPIKVQIEAQRQLVLQNPSVIGQVAGERKAADPSNCYAVKKRTVGGNDEYYSEGYVQNVKPLGACSNLLLLDLSGTMGPDMGKLRAFVSDLSKSMSGGAMAGLSGCETITDADLKKFNSEFAGKIKLERPSSNKNGILILSVNDAKDLSRGIDSAVEYKSDDPVVDGHKEINRGSTRLYEAMALALVKYSQEYAKLEGIGKDAIEAVRKNGKDFPFEADNLGNFPYTKYATYEKNGQEYFLVMYNDNVTGSKIGALPKNAVTAKWFTDALGYSPDIDKDTRIPPTRANAPEEYAYYQVLTTLKNEAGVDNKIQRLKPRKGEYENVFFSQMEALKSKPGDRQEVNWFSVEPSSNPKVVWPTNGNAKEFEADQKLPEGKRKWRKAGEIIFPTCKEKEEEIIPYERKKPVEIPMPSLAVGSITSIFKSMGIGNGGEVCDAYSGAGGTLVSTTSSMISASLSWVTLWQKKDKSDVTVGKNGIVEIELKGEADWYGGVNSNKSPHYDPRTNIRKIMKCAGHLYNEAARQGIVAPEARDKTVGSLQKSREAISDIGVDRKTGELSGTITLDGVKINVKSTYDSKAGVYSVTVPVQKGIELRLKYNRSHGIAAEDAKSTLAISQEVVNASASDKITFNAAGLKYVYEKGEAKAEVYNTAYLKKPEHEVTVGEFDVAPVAGTVAPYSGQGGTRLGDGSRQNNAKVIDLRNEKNVKIAVAEEK